MSAYKVTDEKLRIIAFAACHDKYFSYVFRGKVCKHHYMKTDDITPGDHIVYQIYRTEARFGYFVCESDMLDCHGRNAGYVWIGVFACESVPHGETTIVRKELIRKATRADFETFRHQIPRDFKESDIAT